MLGYYSCLTGFVCSRSVAKSVYLLCNAIINSSWLPRDHVRHVIATYMLTQHIWEFLQVTPGPFPDFWVGAGDEAREGGGREREGEVGREGGGEGR